MKSVTVRQLRDDFDAVLSCIEQGEQVEIIEQGKVVALLTPPASPEQPTLKPVQAKARPDFAARLKRIYGDTVLTGNTIVEERNSRPY